MVKVFLVVVVFGSCGAGVAGGRRGVGVGVGVVGGSVGVVVFLLALLVLL